MVRTAAPAKLVGWAIHDAPVFVKWASATKPLDSEHLDTLLDPRRTYMQQLSAAFDFYGVNTYQTASLESVVGSAPMAGDQLSYGDPSIASQVKPVLLTEIGWSAAGRADPSIASSPLVDTAATQANVAAVMRTVLPQCFSEYKNMCVGMLWFEFADEWWKSGKPAEWNGGASAADFPNGYRDEEAFGLYARRRSGGRTNASSNWAGSGPTLPVDTLVERLPMVVAIKAIYEAATGT